MYCTGKQMLWHISLSFIVLRKHFVFTHFFIRQIKEAFADWTTMGVVQPHPAQMALLSLFVPLPFLLIHLWGVHWDLCSSRRQEDPSKSLLPCSLTFLISDLKGPLNYTAVVVKFMTTWNEKRHFILNTFGFCERFTSGGNDFHQWTVDRTV